MSTIASLHRKKSHNRYYATGRRKEAAARVWISKGSGKVVVNGVELDKYFPRSTLRMMVNFPFVITNTVSQYDVACTVRGGGISGQAGAVSHGISRALDIATGKTVLHKVLKDNSLLTRDSRTVERKKYGKAKARKSFQFSKR